MSQGALRETADGVLALEGQIDLRVGSQLRLAGRRLLASSRSARLVVDCAGISHSSSVGLSLLLCLLRDARAVGKSLEVRSLPAEMRQIAEVYGLLELLPLAD